MSMETPTTPRPLILIIDDVLENVEVLGATLSGCYEILFATSGAKGLALIDRKRPDLILLDVMMPEMNGFEVLEQLRSKPQTNTIPVIFVTARTDAESESAALNAGAADFIHKPINPTVVRSRVRQQLELARYQNHLEAMVYLRTQELAAERDRADSASRAKSAFLTNISHELRTPLHYVIGMSGLLVRKVADEQLKTRLENIHKSGKALLQLLDGLLDLAQIEAGELTLADRNFDPRTLLEDVGAKARAAAEEKGLSLQLALGADLPRLLRGDPECLGKILEQLLSNAVKFSAHGRITLEARCRDACRGKVALRLSVSDEGIGITPSLKAGLFQLFNQGDNSYTRQYGGTGAGLALCRRLAALLGGEMGYTSAPGKGSTFWVELVLPVGHRPEVADTGPAPVDWPSVRELVRQLDTSLAKDDYGAVHLLRESPQLAPVLRDRAAAFAAAVASFDLEVAHRLLRAAIADTPQLADDAP